MLALLGDRVSSGARLFLLSVAIVDDIIAITIIALFYGGELALGWLALAVVAGGRDLAVGRLGSIGRTFRSALALWWAVHESGVHATIAGVLVGLLMPVGARRAC